jgi:lysozyme
VKPSNNCFDLIKEFEGCKLTAYPDPGTGGEPWTIGFGHIENVKPGDTITQDQANLYLDDDVGYQVFKINNLINISMTQNEFDAIVSFVYNIGIGNFANSTLLKKLNMGDKNGAADQFLKWNKAGGKVLTGLTKRREAERQLFLS